MQPRCAQESVCSATPSYPFASKIVMLCFVKRLSFFIAVAASCALFACAHSKPRSSATVVMEGERNPTFREHRERAGEMVRELPPR